MINTFELLKKSKPKIKTGDIFYYKINESFYAGIVLHNHWDPSLKEGTMITCIFLETRYTTVDEISIQQIKDDLLEKKILVPPINTNKRGWTHGYFVMINNINLDFAESALNDIRFFYGLTTIRNLDYIKVPNCPDFKFCGKTALIAHEGIEVLLQISLDLDFTEENPAWYNPYKYYDELVENNFSGDLPFWYHKAKQRLDIDPSIKTLI
jgi:hypothetical protein